jgi:hypothetical protein
MKPEGALLHYIYKIKIRICGHYLSDVTASGFIASPQYTVV